MCGIFGVSASESSGIDTVEQLKIFELLAGFSESRGKDAAGFAYRTDEDLKFCKYPYPPSVMLEEKTYLDAAKDLGKRKGGKFAIIGHSRMGTNGVELNNENNQPVNSNGMVLIHNGIIVNHGELIDNLDDDKRYSGELDTLIIPQLIKKYSDETDSLLKGVSDTYSDIYGMASIAVLFENRDNLLLASNNGSLYYCRSVVSKAFIFASEFSFIEKAIKKSGLNSTFRVEDIRQLLPGTSGLLDFEDYNFELSTDSKENFCNIKEFNKDLKVEDISPEMAEYNKIEVETTAEIVSSNGFAGYFDDCAEKIGELKKCSRCLLPETFPYIHFDNNGVCNYCHSYQKKEVKGLEALKEVLQPHRKCDGRPDCLLPFSGGRDSSYVLHLFKKDLGMKPLAFSYDWGMITDLARRNQSRMCAGLGVEHILISADIKKKRRNIQKNVLAWLKRPELGTIPLFMAGDKQYFYYSDLLKKENELDVVVMGENYFEKTDFKTGFTGAKQSEKGFMAYHISWANKLKMCSYYMKNFLLNPSYLNSSLLDTAGAFFSIYMTDHSYINLFDYIEWDEELVNSTIIDGYQWETEPGYPSTWRIGDGTAPFYNYIYYTVAGFTENDTFRSNQIRAGLISREEAMKLAAEENRPRYEAIRWYCDTINVDFEKAIKTIHSIPKLWGGEK